MDPNDDNQNENTQKLEEFLKDFIKLFDETSKEPYSEQSESKNPYEKLIPKEETQEPPMLKAKFLKTYLDQYVVSQEEAKKILSIGIADHINRLYDPEQDVEEKKHNIMLIGPTGTGKSYIVERLEKILTEQFKIPFISVDANDLTEAGYIGGDIESIPRNLMYRAAELIRTEDDDKLMKAVENGIIYIDEIDKLFSPGLQTNRDVSGQGVQAGLLRMIEGKEVERFQTQNPEAMKRLKEYERESGRIFKKTMNTKNILFITSGSFANGRNGLSLVDCIKERLGGSPSQYNGSNCGFESDIKGKTTNLEKPDNYQFLKQIKPEDLIRFGMIEEIIRRIPVIVPLQDLDKEDLIKILNKDAPDSIIKQWQKKFRRMGITLTFDNLAKDEIAEEAIRRKTGGASSLESVMMQTLKDARYDLEDRGIQELIVTKEMVQDPEEFVKTLLSKPKIRKFQAA